MLVHSSLNPIREGKLINNLLKKSSNLRIYDPKTKKTYEGQEAKDLIDDIKNGRYISSDVRIIDAPNKRNKEDNSEKYKNAKTVTYVKVK